MWTKNFTNIEGGLKVPWAIYWINVAQTTNKKSADKYDRR